MSGNANFPTALDDDSSLFDVTDGVSTLQAAHHNNVKEAIKAIEAKVGIRSTAVATALDYRLGNPTGGHTHDGSASGMGAPISPSSIPATPSEVDGNTTLAGHMDDAYIHNPFPQVSFALAGVQPGSIASGPNRAMIPFAIENWNGNPISLYAITGVLRRGPSGATLTIDVNLGGTSIWYATQANRLFFPPGATRVNQSAFNIATWAAGLIVTADADTVGSSAPGEDLSLTFVFREN